jgi:lipopolysaccharide transport system permease protein
VKFGIQFFLVIIALVWYHFNDYPIQVSIRWLALPLLVIIIAGISFGLGIIISAVTAKYRDLSVLLTFAIQLGMYVTPVAYPYSFLKERSFAWVIQWNPLTPVFEAFRFCLYDLQSVHVEGIWYSILFMMATLFIGSVVFNRAEATFMDTV